MTPPVRRRSFRCGTDSAGSESSRGAQCARTAPRRTPGRARADPCAAARRPGGTDRGRPRTAGLPEPQGRARPGAGRSGTMLEHASQAVWLWGAGRRPCGPLRSPGTPHRTWALRCAQDTHRARGARRGRARPTRPGTPRSRHRTPTARLPRTLPAHSPSEAGPRRAASGLGTGCRQRQSPRADAALGRSTEPPPYRNAADGRLHGRYAAAPRQWPVSAASAPAPARDRPGDSGSARARCNALRTCPRKMSRRSVRPEMVVGVGISTQREPVLAPPRRAGERRVFHTFAYLYFAYGGCVQRAVVLR